MPYARFGRNGFLVAGKDGGAVLFVGEVGEAVGAVEIVGVEKIVVQEEHVVECNIEVGVEEEVVEEVIEKEVGMLTTVGLVEGEVLGKRHWKGLPRDPQGRVALNTFSWRLLLRCFFPSSD